VGHHSGEEFFYLLWTCHTPVERTRAEEDIEDDESAVNSIYCSITVNHRLTGPGKMVKLCLLFVGKFQIQKFD
jgi:hypothetical protein